jgi:hypothetical protein
LDGWLEARSEEERARIWHRMLAIHAEQTLTIGVVSGTFQPIVVNKKLVNIPKKGFSTGIQGLSSVSTDLKPSGCGSN